MKAESDSGRTPLHTCTHPHSRYIRSSQTYTQGPNSSSISTLFSQSRYGKCYLSANTSDKNQMFSFSFQVFKPWCLYPQHAWVLDCLCFCFGWTRRSEIRKWRVLEAPWAAQVLCLHFMVGPGVLRRMLWEVFLTLYGCQISGLSCKSWGLDLHTCEIE